MSVMGGGIPKRFIWIIDPKREHIYLIPNSLFKTNFSDN
jgi:hypothetical protein